MKYIRVELQYPPELMHPIHRLIDESDVIARDVLVQGTILEQGTNTFLFYIEGDIDVYTDALRSVDRIRDFEITRIDETGYYVFLTESHDPVDNQTFDTLQRTGVVVVPPIDFRSNGVARLTIVGEGRKLRKVLAELPDQIGTDVLRVGEYDWRQSLFDPEITNRQLDALTAAVECGYYDTPRRGTVDDVADQIGTSSSTASEHLRKAESAVMSAFINLRDVA